MFSIRPGSANDLETLCSLDEIASRDEKRLEFIYRSIDCGTCFVAVSDANVIGYGVIDHSFFENGSIEMLYVDANHRGRGAGKTLLGYMEGLCTTPKLFVTTNLSNTKMQQLLLKCGYTISGMIHNLDEGDPEIVYFKRLGPDL